MKKTNSIKQLLLIVFCVFNMSVSAQSISGNVNSNFGSARSMTKNLGYANVDIYQNDSLVANVLSDKDGNFDVKLDVGTYRCEINYAGYETIVKEIVVDDDEEIDFSLSEDEESRYSAEKMLSYEEDYSYRKSKSVSYAMNSRVVISNMWGKQENDSIKSGKLTAGEINDFSKWKLWTELTNDELSKNQSLWNFSPTDRYTVQLTNKDGLPLANAKVELLDGKNVVYTSRTDNTGKAELWGSLQFDKPSEIQSASIRVTYAGIITTIDNAKKFEEGINIFALNTKYQKPQNVDIAIVVDATASMQDEMDYLKFDINDVIFQAKEFSNTLNLRFANVFYRDKGDIYLTESQDFTRVLSESIAYANEHNANGGGDYPEAVDVALDLAINNLSWGDDTRTKIIFLVLDAHPHNTPEVQERIINLCYQAAEKGIRIVPLTGSGTNKETEYLMRCIALATNGTYTFLTDGSAIGYSHIKPSTVEYQTEILNDLLVRIIKSYTYMPDVQQQIADLGVNLPDSVVIIHADSALVDVDTNNIEDPNNIQNIIELEWKFYPNPTTGQINIVSNKEIEELYISDLSGKVMQIITDIQPNEVVTADLSGYASGIYLIRYPMGKQWISGKIILMR
ncbi:MAG: T9SS type A sorting domain-containing protein [Bacteroidales bacterium]|nr:T9SS type A sorting domain-containing protein [Bacteroidales bacterium]